MLETMHSQPDRNILRRNGSGQWWSRPSGLHRHPEKPSETSTIGSVGAVLESADGAVYPLDRSYVIGRYPLGDDAVRNATASPIVVHNDNQISRVHAYVSIDHGGVYVRDAFTTGGTFIAAPGAKDWTRIGTTPTELAPEWSLRIGEQILTYRAEDRP